MGTTTSRFTSIVLFGSIAVLLGTLAACGPRAGRTPETSGLSAYHLNIDNGTTLTLSVEVNGSGVARVPPQTFFEVNRSLPEMPWTVTARTPSGRVVLELLVDESSISATTAPDGHTSISGAGTRVDLSCGRLDIWVGAPLLGPPPGSGTPGDCA